jgi:hypothetical protein
VEGLVLLYMIPPADLVVGRAHGSPWRGRASHRGSHGALIICSDIRSLGEICLSTNICERFISEGASPILILAIPPTTASVDQLLLRIKRLLFPLYRKRVHIPHTIYTRDIHKPDIFLLSRIPVLAARKKIFSLTATPPPTKTYDSSRRSPLPRNRRRHPGYPARPGRTDCS